MTTDTKWYNRTLGSIDIFQDITSQRKTEYTFSSSVHETFSRINYISGHKISLNKFSSVQVNCSVMSDSLQPHGLQHTRPPCPLPTPGVYSNSFHWVGDAIQPSHPWSSPSPPAFNLSQHQGPFKWVSSSHGGQSIGVSASASASVLPVNIQDWFPLGWAFPSLLFSAIFKANIHTISQ